MLVQRHGIGVKPKNIKATNGALSHDFFEEGDSVAGDPRCNDLDAWVYVLDRLLRGLEEFRILPRVGFRLPEDRVVGFIPDFPVADCVFIA